MLKLLKGLFARRVGPLGDVALDDWAPVPAHALAEAGDVGRWLEGETQTTRPRRRTLRELWRLADEAEASTQASPLARATGSEDTWVKVLKEYGEHLTDDELAVIREQLGREK